MKCCAASLQKLNLLAALLPNLDQGQPLLALVLDQSRALCQGMMTMLFLSHSGDCIVWLYWDLYIAPCPWVLVLTSRWKICTKYCSGCHLQYKNYLFFHFLCSSLVILVDWFWVRVYLKENAVKTCLCLPFVHWSDGIIVTLYCYEK